MIDKNLIDKLKDKAEETAEALREQYGVGNDGETWPQTKYEPVTGSGGLNLYPNHKTRGFLPPVNISPVLDTVKTFGEYSYKDWRGHMLSLNSSAIETKDKFNESLNIPKNTEDLTDYPYSTRDNYLIFNDNSTDYFKHGLHIIDRLTPIENPINGSSNLRLNNFTSTPFENNDPIIYGFDLIIDDISSPLLNGSILDFIRNYSNVSEIESRDKIYEEFKQQFVKFFKTRGTVRIDDLEQSITKMRESSYPESDNNKNIYQSGKKSYLNYYLKKISGLSKLVENNGPKEKKYLTSYNNDIVTLSFSEDVSMSIATLAHLYKLLYWSKPNGKGIIPENLLRFNCDIIVSEVRNFNRVRKSINSDGFSDIEIIKDNVSRQVYSLKECQFYFNNMPHENTIDMGSNPTSYGEGAYNVQFDYKYVTSKLERFVPTNDGFGQYIGYNSGSIWSTNKDVPVPRFFTVGENSLSDNGVNSPFIISKPTKRQFKRSFGSESNEELNALEQLKRNEKNKEKELKSRLEDIAVRSTFRELQTSVNTRTAILNKTLNKVLNAARIGNVNPPRNIYTEKTLNSAQRIFYDVRGELINFLGDSLGDALNNNFSR